jgi:hypothetical protein
MAHVVGACLLLAMCATTAEAQPPATQPPPESEETEPRIVGRQGTTMIGVSGFLDRAFSTTSLMPLTYTAQVDGLRFATDHIAVHFGVAGSGSIGGDDADTLAKGTGVPALRAFVGGLYFLRPKSILSPYAGAEYWAQLTQRPEKDAGSIVGKLGFQAVLSSRTALFIEGGYGVGLTRGSEDELVTRIVGQIGVRVRF